MPHDTELPTVLVIFGATGDLAQRKLVPALYNLFRKKRLPENFRVVGFARRPLDDDSFREHLKPGVQEHSNDSFDEELWNEFAPRLHYFRGDANVREDFLNMRQKLRELQPGPVHRLYYLAVDPELFPAIVTGLGDAVMASQKEGRCNIVVEKPFGVDLESARALNQAIHEVFAENQVYRIDHYLGKETAQNILFLRFANTIFEPVWNRNYIDNVQISVLESVDVGTRAGYYDDSGVLRDMFQSHLLQLMALTAMEPPASIQADHLRNEKVKVLSAICPVEPKDVVLGQYADYRDAEGVKPDSRTPTYAAIKLCVQNWRWDGVPFYLRSGKALSEKRTEITVEFKKPPMGIFGEMDPDCPAPNILTICIQPDEGIHLRFETKRVDTAQETRSVDMEFHYRDEYGTEMLPEAYERLLLDAMHGDASLFTRSDEIEQAWKLIDPLVRYSESPDAPQPAIYPRGSSGPAEADALLDRDGRCWLNGCEHMPSDTNER